MWRIYGEKAVSYTHLKEDYDVRESNIRKIAQGMGVPASDLFNDNENTIHKMSKYITAQTVLH